MFTTVMDVKNVLRYMLKETRIVVHFAELKKLSSATQLKQSNKKTLTKMQESKQEHYSRCPIEL